MSLSKLVAELLITISALTGYNLDDSAPHVQRVSPETIANKFCAGRKAFCPVHAIFDAETGIWIDERMDIFDDLHARSVLVHELMHFIQWKKTGRKPANCIEWVKREQEAFIVQFRWLNGQSQYAKRDYKLARPSENALACHMGAAAG